MQTFEFVKKFLWTSLHITISLENWIIVVLVSAYTSCSPKFLIDIRSAESQSPVWPGWPWVRLWHWTSDRLPIISHNQRWWHLLMGREDGKLSYNRQYDSYLKFYEDGFRLERKTQFSSWKCIVKAKCDYHQGMLIGILDRSLSLLFFLDKQKGFFLFSC